MAIIAFDAALERNKAIFTEDGSSPAVSISAGCPRRALESFMYNSRVYGGTCFVVDQILPHGLTVGFSKRI
jgi:hypothetical protein